LAAGRKRGVKNGDKVADKIRPETPNGSRMGCHLIRLKRRD